MAVISDPSETATSQTASRTEMLGVPGLNTDFPQNVAFVKPLCPVTNCSPVPVTVTSDYILDALLI